MAAFRIITALTSLLLTWPSITSIAAFNVDVNPSTVTVFTSPASPQGRQYFGYSVAIHSGGGSKWVLIGAPLANVSNNLLNYGTVYKCRPNPYLCQEVIVDHQPEEGKTGQWLGAVVHSRNQKVVTCAPRFTSKYNQEVLPVGRCFLLRADLTRSETLDPCSKSNSETKFCQAGMSAEYDDTADNVLMGAVGIAQWKGGLVKYSHIYKDTLQSTRDQIDQGDYMGYAVANAHVSQTGSAEFVGGAPRADNTKGKVLLYSDNIDNLIVLATLPQPKELMIGSYFGSALCTVDLNADGFTDILVGAPRFTDRIDEGRVYVYINNKKGVLNPSDTVLRGDNLPHGQFGSAIASVGDINNDGFQDVAIGAPYEEDVPGSGAVYIYHGTSEGIESKYRQKILGSSVEPEGLQMFGQSISGNVDVDNNQYPDLAVGAYGSEKVVFFRSRRIIDVTGELTLSESRVVLDSNSSLCKDKNGISHKCISVAMHFKYNDPTRPRDNGLSLEYSLTLDQSVPENLRRMYFLDASNERSFAIQGSFTINQQNKRESLPARTVYIMEKEQIANVISELTFDLTFSLNKTSRCVDGLCPVLNDYMKSASRAVAFFQKKCKNDKCVLDLAVSGDVEYSGDYKQLRIGLVNEMTVQLTVENKEIDTAYDAKVTLRYPSFLGYIGVRSKERIVCEKSEEGNINSTTLTCTLVSPANPMDGLSKRSFGVKFSTLKVKNDFDIKVETSSGAVEDTNKKNNKIELTVPVKFETDLEMKGSSNPDQVVYSKTDAKKTKDMLQKDIGPKIVQTLQIRNNGPSPVDGSEVQINIPSLYGGGTDPGDHLLYLLKVELTGTAGTCNNVTVNPESIPEKKDNTTATKEENKRRKRRDVESKTLDCRVAACKTFKCSLGLLEVGDTVEIQITTRLWQSTLVKNKVGVVDLETDARVKVPEKFSQPDEDNDRVMITTRANPVSSDKEGKSTPWYVIFASVLGGALLLAIASCLLYKFGFFNRKRYGKEISDPQTDEVEMVHA